MFRFVRLLSLDDGGPKNARRAISRGQSWPSRYISHSHDRDLVAIDEGPRTSLALAVRALYLFRSALYCLHLLPQRMLSLFCGYRRSSCSFKTDD